MLVNIDLLLISLPMLQVKTLVPVFKYLVLILISDQSFHPIYPTFVMFSKQFLFPNNAVFFCIINPKVLFQIVHVLVVISFILLFEYLNIFPCNIKLFILLFFCALCFQIQHPRSQLHRFDLVVTPHHDYYPLSPQAQKQIPRCLRRWITPLEPPDRHVVGITISYWFVLSEKLST